MGTAINELIQYAGRINGGEKSRDKENPTTTDIRFREFL